ncbi:MAG: hypothetical protein JSW21_08115 [Gammaproteobacteria bacterium]|nr:MAG: hypothetical protein JSW21_08115 [Gammaproteobacteria bacterium]
MTDAFKNTLAWLLIGTIGVFMAMNWATASFTGAEYLPAGNDSFYHARRILDTFQSPDAFFEFDDQIHVPEGSWITWPWLYDYAMARVLTLIVSLTGADNPMAVLVYMPVFWAYVTIGLVLAIAAALELPWTFRIMAGFCAALLPLNQVLHGVGRIDHHFMEYTFVLLTLAASLNWFKSRRSKAFAALTGFSLGAASGFHNALFVLQIPVLAAFFVCWLRGVQPDVRSSVWMAGGLIAGTLLVVVPSVPFLQGRFDYYLLSWFHLYVAVCTSIGILWMAWMTFSHRSFAFLVAVALVMVVPIIGQILVAGDFFAHRLNRLSEISEAKSVITMFQSVGGPYFLRSVYSLLVFAVPAIMTGTVIAALRSRRPDRIVFFVFSTLGLLLLVQQFRFHYYGSFALYMPILVGASWLAGRYPRRSNLVVGVTLLLFATMLYPAVRYRLFVEYRAGLDSQYQLVKDTMPELSRRCRERPGVVLTYNDAGHYVRFHTDCSVIANNFLLTPQHSDKIRELDELIESPLQKVLAGRPDIRYFLVYYPTVIYRDETGDARLLTKEELSNAPWTLIKELMFSDIPKEDFPELDLAWQVTSVEKDGTKFALARLYEVRPQDEPVDGAMKPPAGQSDTQTTDQQTAPDG